MIFNNTEGFKPRRTHAEMLLLKILSIDIFGVVRVFTTGHLRLPLNSCSQDTLSSRALGLAAESAREQRNLVHKLNSYWLITMSFAYKSQDTLSSHACLVSYVQNVSMLNYYMVYKINYFNALVGPEIAIKGPSHTNDYT